MATKSNIRAVTTCIYCGGGGPMTVDHIIPLSRWQEFRISRRMLDNSSNQVPACQRCNAEKGDMTPQEWFALHPDYRRRFERQAKYLPNYLKRLLDML